MRQRLEVYRERFIATYWRRLKSQAHSCLAGGSESLQAFRDFDADWPAIRAAFDLASVHWSKSLASQQMLLHWRSKAHCLLEAKLTHWQRIALFNLTGEVKNLLTDVISSISDGVQDDPPRAHVSTVLRDHDHELLRTANSPGQTREASQATQFSESIEQSTKPDLIDASVESAHRLAAIDLLVNRQDRQNGLIAYRGEIRSVCESLQREGRSGEARALAILAYKTSARRGDILSRCHLIGQVGELALAAGNASQAIACFSAQLSVADKLGHLPLALEAETNLGHSMATAGGAHEAHRRYEAAFQRASILRDEFAQAGLLSKLSWCHVRREEWHAALHLAERALEIYDGLELPQLATQCLVTILVIHMETGNVDLANDACDRLEHRASLALMKKGYQCDIITDIIKSARCTLDLVRKLDTLQGSSMGVPQIEFRILGDRFSMPTGWLA